MSRHIRAPRSTVYPLLVDPQAVIGWRVPDDMTAHLHEAHSEHENGYRVSLTYDVPTRTGKSAAHTDTYRSRFTLLVPDDKVVEEIEFETDDAALQGVMTMTTTLTDADGGTDVLVVHEAIPDVVPVEQNETGTRMALDRLAALVER